jgi:Fe2+ or Zn2+ uptake regulation protein
MSETTSLQTADRELAILRELQRISPDEEGLSVKDIYQRVSTATGDAVTIQAYYKVLDALESAGKIEGYQDPSSSKRFKICPHLTSDMALRLEDIYEIIEILEPTDALARLIDAREYFQEKRTSILARAAKALLEEDPRDLVFRMLSFKYGVLVADLNMYRDHELRDRTVTARLDGRFRQLQDLSYRSLGLSLEAIDIVRDHDIKEGLRDPKLNETVLVEELRKRVYGETAVFKMKLGELATKHERETMTVSGSDGSTHASSLQIMTATKFVDDSDAWTVHFNNAIAHVRNSDSQRKINKKDASYYSVPMTRSVIDSPANRGMVLSPFMFRYLEDGEYEHLAKCATDVVQWRVDEAVFSGTARAMGSGEMLPKPKVHLRDGTIIPQEREFKHYKVQNEYGDMVREGIAHSRRILERVHSSRGAQIFAGATKTTQKKFYSVLLSWYISEGSKHTLGEAIDPNWDTARAADIPDNEAMSHLLATLPSSRKTGEYYVSFAVSRPFHSLTELYLVPKTDSYDWIKHFEQVKIRETSLYEDGTYNEFPYLAQVADIADDNFVYMCQYADYLSFYVGHTYGDPPPVLPRYEILTVRETEPAKIKESIRVLVEAVDLSGFSQDREHNYLSKHILVKMIPFVIFDAHEKCKALGKKLDLELKSIVIARLQELQQFRVKAGSVIFQPVNIFDFAKQAKNLLSLNGGSNDVSSTDEIDNVRRHAKPPEGLK